jgi:ubiquinone/menaquinone biosynthesis C-methylase UbiE
MPAIKHFIRPIRVSMDFVLKKFVSKKTILMLQSVDQYQRYSPIVSSIPTNTSILDVGGGTGVISTFLKNNITILDPDETELKEAKKKGLKTIKASALKIPKKDNSFDIVTSVATLEHIPKEKRIIFIKELKRVAKEKVLLYTPYGKTGEEYDNKLFKFRSNLGIKDRWTEEHLKNPLPTLSLLKKHFPDAELKFIQNANIWLIIMKLQSIPVLNRFLPGLIYFIFLKWFDNKEPFIGVVINWNKQ